MIAYDLNELLGQFFREWNQWSHIASMDKGEATLADFAKWLDENVTISMAKSAI